MEEMTHVDRIKAAIALKPVDRVPIYPAIDSAFAARSHGVKLSEVVRNSSLAFDLLLQTFDELDGCDAALAQGMNDLGMSVAGMVSKLPGYQLGEDDLWQLDEKEILTVDDYDFIIQNGWNAYIALAYPRLGGLVPAEKFMARLGEVSAQGMKEMRIWEARGVPTLTGIGAFVPFEMFRFSRSLKEIIIDLYRRPEKVLAASEVYLEEQIPQAIASFQAVKQATKWGYLSAFLGQQTAVMLPPRNFNKFFWPYEKRIVNAFVDADITPWLHSDSNWTAYLEYFLELPKGKVVLALDSLTDIFKAKEILKGHMCIAGDVPASLLKLGTTEQVIAYCKKLIDVVGDGSGFILSSGCSVPVDAKPENVKAMVDTGKTYYPHHKIF